MLAVRLRKPPEIRIGADHRPPDQRRVAWLDAPGKIQANGSLQETTDSSAFQVT